MKVITFDHVHSCSVHKYILKMCETIQPQYYDYNMYTEEIQRLWT